MFFAWAFCSILSSCLFKSEFWLEKNLIFHFEIKFPTLHYSTELRSEQVQIAPALSSGILRISLAKRRCLTSLRPNENQGGKWIVRPRISRIWPAKWRVLQRAVGLLAARINNNSSNRLKCSVCFDYLQSGYEWRMTILRRNWRYGNKEENYSTALGNCSRILIRVQFKLI